MDNFSGKKVILPRTVFRKTFWLKPIHQFEKPQAKAVWQFKKKDNPYFARNNSKLFSLKTSLIYPLADLNSKIDLFFFNYLQL
jgi:hypothetical protein